jgi:phage shock protein A
LTVLGGRIQVRCFVVGYSSGGPTSAPARLVRTPQGWELRIGVDESVLGTQMKETAMATEGVVGRIGRVMAGMAHSMADLAEQANPEAVLNQALREIDGAIEEVRGELGRAKSEQMRLEARMKELEEERIALEARIKSAVEGGRDDLAEAGIARQLDIEAQSNLLNRLRGEAAAEIKSLEDSLDAIRASRREAESRLQALRRGGPPQGDGRGDARFATAADRAEAAVERAMNVATRVTGVPSGPAPQGAAALQDLESLHRQNQIKERLAALKAGRS